MKVLVTGAGGFVGRAVLRALVGHHEVIAFDRHLGGIPSEGRVQAIEGDLRVEADLLRALGAGCEAIIHLATIAGGAAEQEPALAWQVNVDATHRLFDAAASRSPGIRIVYASSIAVFGEPLPQPFDEQAHVAPAMLYGAHKAMCELWLSTRTRRGDVKGIALRLPGIVARPATASGLASAFLSNLFHALRAREQIRLPVSSQATTLLMSVDRAAANLMHALDGSLTGSWTLPALHVRLDDLAAHIAAQTGGDARAVQWLPDERIEARFGRVPVLHAPRAVSAGFHADRNLDDLVRAALSAL